MRSSALRIVFRMFLPCLLLTACLVLLGCPPAGEPGDGDDGGGAGTVTLCNGPGESYGIQDFPCTAATVEGWVDSRGPDGGHRERMHAWYLFAGLNQPQGDSFLWHNWPTSTQTFPGQFDESSNQGVDVLSLGPLPGSKLERPVPTTPRSPGGDDVTVDPGVNAENLALPGGPKYFLPEPVRSHSDYAGCVMNADDPATANLIDGPRFQNNGDAMLAGVVYSPDASQWILGQNLWDAFVLDAKTPSNGNETTQATQMPHGSVVLKPMLWPVPYDGYTALPQWGLVDPSHDKIIVEGQECEIYSGFERKALWSDAVAVTTQEGDAEPTVSATYLKSLNVDGSPCSASDGEQPNCDVEVQVAQSYDNTCTPTYSSLPDGLTYDDIPVAGLDRFYTIRFSEDQLSTMDPCDRALIDQTAYWVYGRAFDHRDALVLIAMHMMTKEQPDWTFQSAWWFQDADDCGNNDQCNRYASHRPSDVNGADTWKNYLITTTYGQPQLHDAPGGNQWPPDLSVDTTWPVAFNPYIELAATHPIETNCINCHRRAAWPSRVKKSLSYPDRNAAYLVTGEGVPGLLDQFQLDNVVFDGLTNTDNMWAISDRAYYPFVPEDEEAVRADGP